MHTVGSQVMDGWAVAGAPGEDLWPADSDDVRSLAAVAGVADALMLYDSNGRVRWASPSLQKVFGWRPNDVLNRPFFLSSPHELDGGTWADWCAVTSPSWIQRRHSFGGDGRPLWVEEAVTVVRDREGAVVSAVVTARDITAHMHAMHALAESEERFRAIAEAAAEVVYHCDGDGNVSWVSDSVAQAVGADARAVRGEPLKRWLHPMDHSVWDKAFEAALGGTPGRIHVRIRSADADHRWWSVGLQPVSGAQGDRTGVTGGWVPADDHVRQQHAVAALECAGDLTVQTDVHGRITWASSGATRYLGKRPDQLLGLHASQLVVPDRAPELREVFDRGTRAGITCALARADGDGEGALAHLVCMPVAGNGAQAGWLVNAHCLGD